MGVHIADSDSELFDEKGQTATAPKRSRCPLILLVQILKDYREKREQKYRQRIDEIRMRINKDRKKIEANRIHCWQGTTSTEQRRSIWEDELDSSSLKHCGLTFSTSHTYKLTTSTIKAGTVGVSIHDFRTPEGREEAFKWWDELHQRNETTAARVLDNFDIWEESYQRYITGHHSIVRRFLLRGGTKIIWRSIEVEELPN